jgi:hypothetical protein
MPGSVAVTYIGIWTAATVGTYLIGALLTFHHRNIHSQRLALELRLSLPLNGYFPHAANLIRVRVKYGLEVCGNSRPGRYCGYRTV